MTAPIRWSHLKSARHVFRHSRARLFATEVQLTSSCSAGQQRLFSPGRNRPFGRAHLHQQVGIDIRHDPQVEGASNLGEFVPALLGTILRQERLLALVVRLGDQIAELDRIAADARAERERLDREAAELRRKEQEAIDAERRRIQDERLEQERLDNQRLAAEMARMRAVIADIGNDAAMEPFLTAALNYRDADNERAEMESLLALCQLFRDALNSGSLVDNAALAGKGARR